MKQILGWLMDAMKLEREETHFQKVTQWIKKNEREQGREEHIAY
jgi:hypothetical protein